MTSRKERQEKLLMNSTVSTPSSPTFGRRRRLSWAIKRRFASNSSSPVASRGSSPTRNERNGSDLSRSAFNLLLQSVVDCEDNAPVVPSVVPSASASVRNSTDAINQKDVEMTRHLVHPELYDYVDYGDDYDHRRAVPMSSSPDRVRSMSMSALNAPTRKPSKDRNFVAAIFHRMNRYVQASLIWGFPILPILSSYGEKNNGLNMVFH